MSIGLPTASSSAFPELPRRSRSTNGVPRGLTAFALAVGIQFFSVGRVRGESHVDYKYEDYQEDGQRVHVRTHSVLAESELKPWLKVKGQYVYDGISGASPDGRPAPSQVTSFDASLLPLPPLSSQVALQKFRDIRRAYNLEAAMRFDRHTLTPQISYSGESDYISRGAALNYGLDFNQKNTTLNLGAAYTWDHIIPRQSPYLSETQQKHVWDFLVGVNQLLGPRTLFTANFTLSTSAGYLNDPYKGIVAVNYPQFFTEPENLGGLEAEHRPGHRVRETGYFALTQSVEPARASVEATYRVSHDSYGILSHTVGLAWLQKVGKYLILTPSFRYYRQSAADFYYIQIPGDFSDRTTWPNFYSADYRLSALESFTYGMKATINLHDRVHVDLGYKRYVMCGNDGMTVASAYPSANVFTAGLRVWF